MMGWIIIAVFILIIVAILLIPIGADIRYEDGVVRISAKAAGIKLQLLPKPKKTDKPEKPKKERKKKDKPPKNTKPKPERKVSF